MFFNTTVGSASLIATGPQVTDQATDTTNLGGGANVNGGGTQAFDFGVEIGQSGIGRGDDFYSTTFQVSSTSGPLDLATFFEQDAQTGDVIALRLTSVTEGTGRNGSSKLSTDTIPGGETPGTPGTPVPEPVSMALLGTALVGFSLLRRKRS